MRPNAPLMKPSKDRSAGSGRTQTAGADADVAPLPHERDESSDEQAGAPPVAGQDVGEQAQRDLARGLEDTDRGPVLDELYRERVKPATDGGKKEPGPRR